jgi:hypothetical protein
VGFVLLLAGVASAAAGDSYFDARVAPILRARCLGCHNEVLRNGGVSFWGRDGLLKGGVHGPTLVAGKPEASLLLHAVRQDGPLSMPPGAKLSAADIATLEEWIRMGAPWGDSLRLVEIWKFDRLDSIGGHPTKVLGHPRVIDSPVGRAVEFNGIDDALFVETHPLAGADTFTWEVFFRPDVGGNPAQRFFHLQENGTDTRMLLEIRIVDGRWCLDSFAITGKNSRTLLDRTRLHPLGKWYHVAMVYDGLEFRNYVNGVLQGAGELHLDPQGQGRSSIGVRINLVDYFKGAVALARMTKKALKPEEFLSLPAQ